MRILRAVIRVAEPWQDGGGAEVEIASFPEGAPLNRFGWRIGLTEAREARSFTMLPDVDSQLMLLEGRASLAVEGQEAIELTSDTPVVSVPRDVPMICQPLVTGVTYLNLLTHITRCKDGERRALALAKSQTIAIVALLPLAFQVRSNRMELGRRDALLLSRGDGRSVELHSGPQDNDYLVIKIDAAP